MTTSPTLSRLSLTPLAARIRQALPGLTGRDGTRAAAGGTDHLSAERLADMGLPAQSAQNRRASWEHGPMPRVDLW